MYGRLNVPHHLLGRQTHSPNPPLAHPPITGVIPLTPKKVRHPINFNHKRCLMAIEIGAVRAQRMLPPELPAAKSSGTQSIPDRLLRRRGVTPLVARQGIRFRCRTRFLVVRERHFASIPRPSERTLSRPCKASATLSR
jgi:hypothetical protein